MEKVKITKFVGLFIFLIGVIFSLNSSLKFTGAFIGSETLTHSFSFFLGLAFLILGIIIFSTASLYNLSPTLERRVVSNSLSSSIKEYPSLVRLTKEAVEDRYVQKDMNHLIQELSKGNLQAGSGLKHLPGTPFIYARSGGARLFFQQTGGDSYTIVAKASKKNEQKVIDKLREISKSKGYKRVA
jgi:hypothetical protein